MDYYAVTRISVTDCETPDLLMFCFIKIKDSTIAQSKNIIICRDRNGHMSNTQINSCLFIQIPYQSFLDNSEEKKCFYFKKKKSDYVKRLFSIICQLPLAKYRCNHFGSKFAKRKKRKLPTYLWLYVAMQDFSVMYMF